MMAETVIPAYKPRYAFAAPRTIARNIPTRIALVVNSGIVFSAGINEGKFSRVIIFRLLHKYGVVGIKR
jgi:hypothetical protein